MASYRVPIDIRPEETLKSGDGEEGGIDQEFPAGAIAHAQGRFRRHSAGPVEL